MKFRKFVTTPAKPLNEADLLGVPASGTSENDPPRPAPSQSKATGPEQPQNIGFGPPPRQMTDQMQKAIALTGELGKVLTGLPHPWNKHFYGHLQHLQALLVKLKELA